jgi:hypothetical protein
MHHAPAAAVYGLKLFLPCPVTNFWMLKEPFFIKAIDQVIIPVICLFPAEKHIQPSGRSLFPGIFIAPTILIDPFVPGKIPVYGGISPEKMIRNDDPCIA